jgi:hypothetical protein
MAKKKVDKQVDLSLCLTKNHMKTYGDVEVYLHAFLTWTLDEGEWTASHTDRYTPGERTAASHWIGDRVGPRAGLDSMARIEPQSPSASPAPYTE